MTRKKPSKGKPHIKWPSDLLNKVPAFQRAGSVPANVGTNRGKPVTGGTFQAKKHKPYVAPPPKPQRKDYIMPPAPPRIPDVFVSAKAADSIAYLVDECSIELGWVGIVEQVNRWKYIIHDIRVMDQEATGASFEYEDWNEAVSEMIMKGTMQAGMVDANLGHSHVNMGVTPSGTDAEQMMDLAHLDDDKKPTAKFSIQTIYNKSGTVYCAIYDWEHALYYTHIKMQVMSSLTAEDIADLDEQLKRVKTKTYSYGHGFPATPYYGGVYGRGQGGAYKSPNDSFLDRQKKHTLVSVDDGVIDTIALPHDDPEQGELFGQVGMDDFVDIEQNDYVIEMEDWGMEQWKRWQKGDPIEDINREFYSSQIETRKGTIQ